MVNELLDVIRVDTKHDYTLHLTFENGEQRVFDMTPLMAKKPFDRLRDPECFAMAHIDYGTVVWPGNIDIAPETLYDRSDAIPVGEFKSFGPVGPKYQVCNPLRKMGDGDWIIEVMLIESGEKAEYRLSKIHQDPAAI